MKRIKAKDHASKTNLQETASANEEITIGKIPTPSDVIWENIKDIQISLFALPAKRLSELCKRDTIEPSKCFLVPSAFSLLPILEEAIGDKYTCEMMQKYIIISNK